MGRERKKQSMEKMKDGVPGFALPWMRLGRLMEKERWQALGLELLQKRLEQEVKAMEKGCEDVFTTSTLTVKLSKIQRRDDALPNPVAPLSRRDSIDVKADFLSCVKERSARILRIVENLKLFFPPPTTS